MRVFAIHDVTGEISAIVTVPEGGPAAGMMMTRAGSQMTEVKMPAGVKIADDNEGNVQELVGLIKQYRVNVEPSKLERRGDAVS